LPTRYIAGVDGGGTKTTVALADEQGRELARRVGPAGLVDPRDPTAAAEIVARVIREAIDEAGIGHPPEALCAGLAGVGNATERQAVEDALSAAGLAGRVRVVTDGEIALDGALGGGAGIMVIAGTGSIAYGRAEDGREERCGGWGMTVGDEGSGYAIGRGGLAAALRADDGRGEPTRLLPLFLEVLELADTLGIPPWVGRSSKAEIAALCTHVIVAAGEGDAVARALVEREARQLALHVVALYARLGPWTAPVPVVFHGGVLGTELYSGLVARALDETGHPFQVRPPVADAVAGALRYARALLAHA